MVFSIDRESWNSLQICPRTLYSLQNKELIIRLDGKVYRGYVDSIDGNMDMFFPLNDEFKLIVKDHDDLVFNVSLIERIV